MTKAQTDRTRVFRKTTGLTAALALSLALLAPLAVAASGDLTGKVLSASGEPLKDVEITLRVPGDPVPTVTGSTNQKGKFTLDVPTPGTFIVRMVGEGHAPFDTEVAFEKGEKRSLNVRMITIEAVARNKAIAAYNEGVKALEEQDTATAKQKFVEAAAIDPGLAEPWPVLARLYMTDGQYAEAAEAAETYLRHDPGATDGMVIAYNAYRELDDQEKLENVREALRRNPELAPKLAVHIYNEGAEAYGDGNDDGAIAAFRTAIELDPQLAAAHSGLANSLYRVGRYDDGLAGVNAWLVTIPGDPTGLQMKFLMLHASGKRDEAEEVLRAFAEQNPTAAAELLLRRAELDFEAGNKEAARRGLLQAVELKPDLARAHYRLGLIYSSSDVGKAKEHLQRFVDLTPDDPDAGAARQLMAVL